MEDHRNFSGDEDDFLNLSLGPSHGTTVPLPLIEQLDTATANQSSAVVQVESTSAVPNSLSSPPQIRGTPPPADQISTVLQATDSWSSQSPMRRTPRDGKPSSSRGYWSSPIRHPAGLIRASGPLAESSSLSSPMNRVTTLAPGGSTGPEFLAPEMSLVPESWPSHSPPRRATELTLGLGFLEPGTSPSLTRNIALQSSTGLSFLEQGTSSSAWDSLSSPPPTRRRTDVASQNSKGLEVLEHGTSKRSDIFGVSIPVVYRPGSQLPGKHNPSGDSSQLSYPPSNQPLQKISDSEAILRLPHPPITSVLDARESRLNRGIQKISGNVKCKRCKEEYVRHLDIVENLSTMAEFISINESLTKRGSSTYWYYPEGLDCTRCGSKGITKPLLTSNDAINWLFLFWGKMLGFCNKGQLNYYCNMLAGCSTSGAKKDELLVLVYSHILNQLEQTTDVNKQMLDPLSDLKVPNNNMPSKSSLISQNQPPLIGAPPDLNVPINSPSSSSSSEGERERHRSPSPRGKQNPPAC